MTAANISKQMLDHVRRVQNALNNACLAREELDKPIAILEGTK